MADFVIKQNDTRPIIQISMKTAAGAAVNLTGATVRFHMGALIDAAATVTDAANGVAEYEWQPGDTATAGTYSAEFEVTYLDGGIETFPNSGDLSIRIVKEIA